MIAGQVGQMNSKSSQYHTGYIEQEMFVPGQGRVYCAAGAGNRVGEIQNSHDIDGVEQQQDQSKI